MELIIKFILSFISTVGFSIIFSAPKNSLIHTGLVGASGWSVYYISSIIFSSDIVGSFFGALTVGILSEIFARLNKKPATLYINPGIIPLVPGAGTYYTMFALVERDFSMAINNGFETFSIAAAIAVGLIISSIFSQSITRVRQKD